MRILLVALIAAAAVALQSDRVAHGATLTVDTTADDSTTNGNCTFREAITASNTDAAVDECPAGSGTDTIAFDISGGGPHTIQPTSALPTITDPVIVDGTTEPDFAGTPIIELDGSSAVGGVTGLTISAGGSTVRGLVVNQFGLFGVRLLTGGGNTVAGNYIGTDVAGTADLGNNSVGIAVNSGGNTIGGSGAADGNVISGNGASGIEINGAGADNNTVQGNVIGTDVNGTLDIGNNIGVLVNNGADNNTIGGAAAGEGNLISGSNTNGISVTSTSHGNVIQGNLIGTNAAGTADIGNSGEGVSISSDDNTVGGTSAGARNVISGNAQNGVLLSGGTGNALLGNYIGTDAAGMADLGNTLDGVLISNAPGNDIGGTAAGAGNLISANGLDGVEVIGTLASGNEVLGNYIGTDAGGTVDLGNGDEGVAINGAPNNTVGGTAAGARNIISGNTQDGVLIVGSDSSGNVVIGNYIGTDVTGTSALGNSLDGVRMSGAPSNIVGGTEAGAGNLISGNGGEGVGIGGSVASGNTVQGNYIGTDVTGTADLGNSGDGVFIINSPDNAIGGTAAGARNIISGNGSDGVEIRSASSTGDQVLGNYIGTDVTGTVDLGNEEDGVQVLDGPGDVTIGGTAGTTPGGACSGACNVISGNDSDGVDISGATTSGNVVLGNFIGTDVNGVLDLGNAITGVLISGGAGNNTIGGTSASARNVISGNESRGVTISASAGISVLGNYIGTDTTGTADLGNGVYGVLMSGGSINNTVGDSTPGGGNVISGNDNTGVLLNSSNSNSIVGNLIGTDGTGTAAIGNTNDGVFLNGSANNVVGGTIPGARNVISGNGDDGVSINFSSASNHSVLGNYIGTDVTGSVDLGNGGNGVLINAAPDSLIGGTAAGARNVISGNGENGIEIGGSAVPNNASGNEVLGNYIGTDATGTLDLGNTLSGVKIDRSGNTVGGTASGAGNVISGNDLHGVDLQASGTPIQGNYIGTDASGTAALGNGGDGLFIDGDNNSIGGSGAGAGNVISGNGSDGAEVAPGEFNTDNTFQGNFIGTDVTGTVDLGNAENGVLFNDAPFNFIGGLTGLTTGGPCTGSCNLISGNDQHGVEISGSDAGGSDIVANYIGTDVSGKAPLGNALNGIFINDAPGTLIGGTTLATRNVISANGLAGVRMFGSNATGNTVRGNIIGADAGLLMPLGNGTDGVLLNGAPDNDIGVPAMLLNWIWYNGDDGVEVSGAGATGNTVLGSIFANGGQGINNSSGGNTELAPPVVTSAGSAAGTACANCTVDVYSDDDDEGQVRHGSVVADGAGNWNFAGGVIGPSITATATDGSGNTSEFSAPLTMSGSMVVDSTADTNTADDVLTLREAMLLDKGGIGGNGTTSGLGRALTAGEADNVTGSPDFISADTITFDTGVFPFGAPSTITLTSVLPIMDVGHTTIDATNQGGTAAGVIVDGPGVARCFDIQDSRVNAILGLQITGCGDGIRLTSSARENVIGGAGAGEGNVISGNTARGVLIAGSSTVNQVIGNLIGTTPDGTAADGNGSEGVRIEGGAHHNQLGGAGAGEGNLISANGFTGVEIFQASDNLVEGNYLGTDVTGTADLGNTGNGVTMDQASGNTVIGNLVSGNESHGVSIFDPSATGNEVTGNLIGTDVTGTVDLGNSVFGLNIGFGQNNIIGGTTAEDRNVISGNGSYGISLNQDATANEILGNYIGTDVSGATAMSNDRDGVIISGSPGNIVGGTEGTTPGGPCTGACNLISGNAENGIEVTNEDSTNNQLLGNFIGTDVTGTAALGNGQDGVHINDAPDNTIGGADPGAGNLISGNAENGIEIGASASGNVVRGNHIGTDAAGTAGLGNALDGVYILGAASNTVGGDGVGERNVISGNGVDGVEISGSGSSANAVLGNYVGVDASGQAALGNGLVGVRIVSAPGSDIGGSQVGAGNVISGNTIGVVIFGAAASGNSVQGNEIGTDASGLLDIGNSSDGVFINGAPSNAIGGTDPGAGNVISGNDANGVQVAGVGASGNDVFGNYIGTDAPGTSALGNAAAGVLVNDAPATDIGASVAGGGNVISANLRGVQISSDDASGTEVVGNRIGTDASGMVPLGNTLEGISITGGAPSNEIGEPVPESANTIAFNGGDGVEVDGAGSTGNAIRGNSIHSNGGLGIDNVNGGNTELAPPIITSVGSASGTACANCTVDVYSDGEDEGRLHHGSTVADGAGDWSFPSAVAGPNVTATATDGAGNTSEFSGAFASFNDSDGDGYGDDDEFLKGSDLLDGSSTPEHCDGVDNDGDTEVDEEPVGGDWDVDADTVLDCLDADVDTDGDTVVNTLDDDDDGDGFTDAEERSLTTDELAPCPSNAAHDAWPPDANQDTDADVGDLLMLFANGKILVDDTSPLYSARSDMDGDGDLDVGDLLKAFFDTILTTCT